MLKLFLGNQISALFLLPLFVAGYLFLDHQYLYFDPSESIEIGFWGSMTLSKIENFIPWLSGILVLFNAYFLNFLFNINGFYEKNSYIVSLLYVILLSYYRSFYFLDGLLIAQTFVLFAFMQLYKLEYNLDGRSRAFNAGLFFGIATTFHPPLAFVLPFLWLMITRIRPFVFREAILAALGMLVPLIYAFSTNWYLKRGINFNFIESTKEYTQAELIFLSSLVLFLFLILTSWIGIRNKSLKSSIRFRKNTNMLYLFLLFCFGMGSIDWIFFQQYEWFCFCVIPIAMFLPFSYINLKFKFVPHLLFYITFTFSVIKFFI